MSGNDQGNGGMTPEAALKVEYAIIGLGALALLMIFQPFNITLFALGCVLVVLAAPRQQSIAPGAARPAEALRGEAMIVAMIFCVVLLVAIFATYLYGVFFLRPVRSSSTHSPGICTASHGLSRLSPAFWLA